MRGKIKIKRERQKYNDPPHCVKIQVDVTELGFLTWQLSLLLFYSNPICSY